MGEFRIYSVLGYQLEPKVTDPSKREDLLPFINNSVDFYVDLSKLRVVCAFEADSSHVSRNRQRFVAEYLGDSRDRLLEELMDRIAALETNEYEEYWDLIDDTDAESAVWYLEEAGSRTLEDLGLNLGKELVLESLLEEGAHLDMGMSGVREATIAVVHFVDRTDIDAEIAISSNGRTPAVETAELVLNPGSDANFDPLTEDTRRRVAKQLQEQEGKIRDRFESTTSAEIESIVDSEYDVWHRYAELDALESALETTPPSEATVDYRTDSAERVHELVDALVRDVKLSSERIDPRALTESTKEDLRNTVLSRIRKEKERIEENAYSLTKSEYSNLIEDLEKRDPGIEYQRLQEIRSVLDEAINALSSRGRVDEHRGSRNVESAHDTGDTPSAGTSAVESIAQLTSSLEESSLLTGQQKHDLVIELDSTIKSRLAEIVEEERERLTGRLEQCIQNPGGAEQLDEAKRLEYALHRIDPDHDGSGVGRGDASLSEFDGDEVSFPEFDDALEQLQKNEILSPNDVNNLRVDIREQLQARIEEIRQDRIERYRKLLSSDIEEIEGMDSSIDDQYRQLEIAKRVCEPRGTVDGIPDELGSFSNRINRLSEEHLLTDDDVRKIRQKTRTQITAKQGELEEEKRDQIKKEFESGLDRVFDRLNDENHEDLYVRLKQVNQYLQEQSDRGSLPDKTYFSTIRDVVLELTTPVDGVHVLDTQDLRQLRKQLRQRLEETKRDIRKDKLRKLKQELDGALSEFRDARFRTADKVVTLQGLLPTHSGGSTTIELPSNDPDERYLDELKQHYERLHAIGETNVSEDDSRILTFEDIEEFEEYYTDQLSGAKTSLEEELVDKLVTRVQESYHETLIGGLKEREPDPEEIDAAIEEVKDVKSNFRRICNGTLDESEIVSDRIIGEIHSLNTSNATEVRNRCLERLDEITQQLKEMKRESAKDAYDDQIDSIWKSGSSLEEQLRALNVLGNVLNRGSRGDHRLVSDTSKLQSLRSDLPRKQKRQIDDRIEDVQSDVFERYRNSVIERIEEAFRAHEESTRKTSVAADSFIRFMDNEDTALKNEDDPNMEEAVSTVGEYKSLYNNEGAITHDQYESLNRKVREIASEYHAETDTTVGGGSAAVFGLVNTNWLPSRSSVVRGLPLLVLGLVVGALVATALPTAGLGGAPAGGADAAGTNPFDEVEIRPVDADGGLMIRGTVLGNVSDIDIRVDGPGTSINTTAKVIEGQFIKNISGGGSGTYEISIRPTNGGENWFAVTSTVPGSSNKNITQLELTEPRWGEATDERIVVNGSTNGARYTVRILNENGSVVYNETDETQGGRINTEYTPESPGRYYISVTVHGENPSTELRVVDVGQ